MKLAVYLGGMYNSQVNKHKNTALTCERCNEANDQNAVTESIIRLTC